MSGGLLSTKNFNVKYEKVNRPTFVNGPSYIAIKNSILFLPTEADITSEKAGELPGVCYSWELSQARTLQWNLDREEWSEKKQRDHVNVLSLGLMGEKFAIHPDSHIEYLKFSFGIQMDNRLPYCISWKWEGSTHSRELLNISVSIYHYLLAAGIITSAEYLPSKLNSQADWEPKNVRESSDWKLHQDMFQSNQFGYPTVDLFASRLCHQLPQHVTWYPDPNGIVRDAVQQCLNKMFPNAFPTFNLISWIL